MTQQFKRQVGTPENFHIENVCVICGFVSENPLSVDKHFEEKHPDFTDKVDAEARERTLKS